MFDRYSYFCNSNQNCIYNIEDVIRPVQSEWQQRPDVSIVIVNYNVRDFLHHCLLSLQPALQGLSGEIIVVDNHSNDGSVEFLRPLFPDVEFIALDHNIGFGKANNLGFARAKGRYILCLNPDTLLSEDTLQVMTQYMDSHPEVGLSGCKLLNGDGSFQLACRRGYPTPWVAFTKTFGLQALFPGTRLFGRYNQTFRPIDETYNVEAVSGAFMFIRREALDQVLGFDPDFFMYGEDLDLCYRVMRHGWKITYVHTTSVIHFKGESTKRSTLNEVKVFYEAMAIFAQKHFASSKIFLLFLRAGIVVRTGLAYLNLYSAQLLLMLLDILSVNAALLVSTKIRMGEFLGFPAAAYPTVFIAVSLVVALSMLLTGEYFSRREPSIRGAFTALMISFFVLSSFTYFFKAYAFSRGVLLMTIGFSIGLTALVRLTLLIFDKMLGTHADRRIAVMGLNDSTERLLADLQQSGTRTATVVGLIATADNYPDRYDNMPVLGNVAYLDKLIARHHIHEVIITDNEFPRADLMRAIIKTAGASVHFHFATMYDEVVAARIIEKMTGTSPAFPQYNITLPKYRFLKRAVDVAGALFLLTIGLPVVYLTSADPKIAMRKIKTVLHGKYSLFGLYPIDGKEPTLGKIGLTGLAHISDPEKLSQQAIHNLNDFYVRRYTLSLDLEIFLKFFFRRSSGSR